MEKADIYKTRYVYFSWGARGANARLNCRRLLAPFFPGVRCRRLYGIPHLSVIQIDADHFDPYIEPYFPQTLKTQLGFLNEVPPILSQVLS